MKNSQYFTFVIEKNKMDISIVDEYCEFFNKYTVWFKEAWK